MEGIRIQKVLSDSGILSRRKAEEAIAEGRILVNGRPAVLGQRINPKKDHVSLDGQRLALEERQRRVYLMLYKPRGYVTTLSDEMGRRCVQELVESAPARVYPIGRLDKNSEGMLLLTNDGEFANLVMHPSHHVAKTYRVTVPGAVSEEQLVALSAGVELEDGVTMPAQVQVVEKEPGRTVLQIVLHEGRNRQIRRMCEAVGLSVSRLKRTHIGPLKLGMLGPGRWRELTPAEVGALRNAANKATPPSSRERDRAARKNRSGQAVRREEKKYRPDVPKTGRGAVPGGSRRRP